MKAWAFGAFDRKEFFRGFINRNVHKNGDEIWLSTSGVPVFDREGKLAGFRGVDIDITELKRAQDALAESEVKSRTVLDFTYDWEYWISPEGVYLYVSPSCERITGYRADEFMKDSGLLQTIVHPEDRDILSRHHSDYCGAPDGNEDVGKVEFRIAARDGRERWVGHLCQPVRGADGVYLGRRASNRDITERKKSQEMLEHYRFDLEDMVKKRTAELARVNKEIRKSEERLIEQKEALEEKNVALREILEQLGVEKKKFKNDIVANIENLVIPVLRKLETEEGQFKREYLALLKRNLEELATSFGSKLSEPRLRLTPREIEVCDMIKTGLSIKDIARMLHISRKTVEKHRENIRRKLDITNRAINLSTYLQSL